MSPRPVRLVASLVVLALAVMLTSAGCAGRRSSKRPAAPNRSAAHPAAIANAVVTRLVDGDTIRVRIAGRQERVRLIGIDTPETKDPRKPVQCYGKAASERTAALLPPGTAVRLVRDAEARDKYGRLLAYVYRASDGLFVNLLLAREGYAVAYTFPPNVAHEAEFVAAAADARQANRGLWAACGGPGHPASETRATVGS